MSLPKQISKPLSSFLSGSAGRPKRHHLDSPSSSSRPLEVRGRLTMLALQRVPCIRLLRRYGSVAGNQRNRKHYIMCFVECSAGHNLGCQKREPQFDNSKRFLIKFISEDRFLGAELVTFLGPKFGFAKIWVRRFFYDSTMAVNDSGPMQILIHPLQHFAQCKQARHYGGCRRRS